MRSLNALDRYLFLYLLSNQRSGRLGIYEISLNAMASESGIDEKDLKFSMLQRLEPKVYYKEGWVIIINYLKHQLGGGPKYTTGVNSEFNLLPPKIREIAIGYGYPIDTLSIGYSEKTRLLHHTKPYQTKYSETEFRRELVSKDWEGERPDRRVKDKLSVYSLFGGKQPWWNHKQQREAALRLFDYGIQKVKLGKEIMKENEDDQYCPQADTPFDYEKKIPALKRFMKRNGL